MAFTTPGYDLNPATGLRKKKIRGSLGTLPPGVDFGALQFPGGVGGGQIPGGGGQQRGPITTPSYTPDYKTLIQQALAPLQAQLGAEGSADAATRNAALIRGIGQFGEQFDPASAQAAFGQDFYNQAGLGGLLGQANQLAAENTKAGFSFSAKAKEALAKKVQQSVNELAAR